MLGKCCKALMSLCRKPDKKKKNRKKGDKNGKGGDQEAEELKKNQ